MPENEEQQKSKSNQKAEEFQPATNGVETPFEDPNRQLSNEQRLTKQAADFYNDYDVLSPEQLIELSQDQSPEGRSMLAEIAERYDIPMSPGSDPQEVVQKIIVAMDSDDSPNPIIP